MQTVTIRHQTFHFHHSGAAFWEEKDALLIADVHLGKISHFRKYGSAVPQQAIGENFKRLQAVTEKFSPKKIIFLGDLFHSALNQEWQLFEGWCAQQSAEIILIAGNHDIISTQNYEALDIRVIQELKLGNFRLTHHPGEQENSFNICGHVHPGFRLQGLGKQQLKLRCFFKRKNQLILPAFGSFTGNFYMRPQKGEKIYACGEEEVVPVTQDQL